MATEDAGTAVELVEDVEISLKSDMPESLLVLRRTIRDVECTYYILGTAHVSKQSCLDAAVLIQKIKPGIVLIELCSERQNLLNTESIKVCITGPVFHFRLNSFHNYSWISIFRFHRQLVTTAFLQVHYSFIYLHHRRHCQTAGTPFL